MTGPLVTAVDTAVYVIPTDAPEADGTLTWDSTTMVLVTHNLAFARQAASRFGVLDGGRLTVSNQPEILDRLAPEWR